MKVNNFLPDASADGFRCHSKTARAPFSPTTPKAFQGLRDDIPLPFNFCFNRGKFSKRGRYLQMQISGLPPFEVEGSMAPVMRGSRIEIR